MKAVEIDQAIVGQVVEQVVARTAEDVVEKETVEADGMAGHLVDQAVGLVADETGRAL